MCSVFSYGYPILGSLIGNSTLSCKLFLVPVDFAEVGEGLCWEKRFSAVPYWADIFIEQPEQTASRILFYPAPKVLPTHTHTHTHTHTAPFPSDTLHKTPAQEEEVECLSSDLQRKSIHHPPFLSYPLFVQGTPHLLWLLGVGFMKSFWIFSRVGYKWMLSTSHMSKWFPVLCLPCAHPAPNKVLPWLLLVCSILSIFIASNWANTAGWGTKSSLSLLVPSLSSWLCGTWPQTVLWNHFLEHQTLPNFQIKESNALASLSVSLCSLRVCERCSYLN